MPVLLYIIFSIKCTNI